MLARDKTRGFRSAAPGTPVAPIWTRMRSGASRPSALSAGDLQVLQVTDLHLYGDPECTLLGVNTQHSFECVLEQAVQALGIPDLLLATGDLVHDHKREGYARLHAVLNSLGASAYWLPGNHDDPQVMRQVLTEACGADARSVRHGNWQIAFLDSRVHGSDGGRVEASELQALDEDLGRYPDHHALVCLHHPPVAIGSRWMDEIGLANGAELFAVLDRHPQVRAVLCGHIHQAFETRRAGVRIFGSPSTCFQFKPCSDDFALDFIAPGYRWLVLRSDGTMDTGVERVEGLETVVDMASTGY